MEGVARENSVRVDFPGLAQAIRRIELLFTEMEEVCGKSRFGGKSDSTSWEIIISS